MKSTTHTIEITSDILQRGYWLFVWESVTPEGKRLYYVGRTGETSEASAQSPFFRIGGHLNDKPYNGPLQKHLKKAGTPADQCSFRLITYGPVYSEPENPKTHESRREQMSAMEKALARALKRSDLEVINSVNSKVPLDEKIFAPILKSFAKEIKGLSPEIQRNLI